MNFSPSDLSYRNFGQAEEAPAAEGEYIETLVAQFAPVIKTVAETAADPTQQVEVIQARIANLEQTKRFAPALTPVIDRRLKVLYAKLKAAKIRKKKQMEQYRSRRTFRSLSQTAIVTSIIVGAGLLFFLSEATKTQKAKQQLLRN